MAKPFNNFEFATDTNYATGPDVGTPTKVAPSAGEIDSGFVRGTASVAQHVNWLFGQVQEWLEYLAGLTSDSEFLGDMEGWIEAHPFIFTALETFNAGIAVSGDINVTGNVIAGTSVASSGPVSGSAGNFTNGSISNNLNVGNNLTVAETITAETIVMESRTIVKEIPITGFSPAMQFTTVWELRSYVGGGSSGYGFHVFGDKLAGSFIMPSLEFTIPTGATLTSVRVGRRMSQGSGNHDFGPFTLDSIDGGVNSANITNDIAPPFTVASSTTGSTTTMTVTSPTPSVFSTRYRLTVEPSIISDFGDPDCVFKVEAVYTTTHVDPND